MSRYKERTTKSLIGWLYSRFPYHINDDTEDHLGDIKRKLRRLDRLQSQQPSVTRGEIVKFIDDFDPSESKFKSYREIAIGYTTNWLKSKRFNVKEGGMKKISVTNSEIVRFVLDYPPIPHLAQEYLEDWLTELGVELLDDVKEVGDESKGQ